MIPDLKPSSYLAMKDSGVDTPGTVPAHCQSRSIRT